MPQGCSPAARPPACPAARPSPPTRWPAWLQGATFGLTECIYNNVSKEGGYSIRSGAKLFWVVFWSFQQAWLACFSGLVALAMFGEQEGKGEGECRSEGVSLPGQECRGRGGGRYGAGLGGGLGSDMR